MEIRFKKLDGLAREPFRASDGAACFDIYATRVQIDVAENGVVYTCSTGLAMEIPEGHAGLLFPRSSCVNTGLIMGNCVGVIDSDYRGEIKAKFYLQANSGAKAYEAGDRVAQLMIIPVPQVKFIEASELSETKRGTGGYGSTGRR